MLYVYVCTFIVTLCIYRVVILTGTLVGMLYICYITVTRYSLSNFYRKIPILVNDVTAVPLVMEQLIYFVPIFLTTRL